MDNIEILREFYRRWETLGKIKTKFAENCGYTPKYLSFLEKGERTFTNEAITRINAQFERYGYNKRLK